jgi:hypothetical protein
MIKRHYRLDELHPEIVAEIVRSNKSRQSYPFRHVTFISLMCHLKRKYKLCFNDINIMRMYLYHYDLMKQELDYEAFLMDVADYKLCGSKLDSKFKIIGA